MSESPPKARRALLLMPQPSTFDEATASCTAGSEVPSKYFRAPVTEKERWTARYPASTQGSRYGGGSQADSVVHSRVHDTGEERRVKTRGLEQSVLSFSIYKARCRLSDLILTAHKRGRGMTVFTS